MCSCAALQCFYHSAPIGTTRAGPDHRGVDLHITYTLAGKMRKACASRHGRREPPMVSPSRYMHPSKAFELLAARCEKLNVPRTFKDELVHRLNYFKIQSLCDHDRREDDRKIREHWAEFEGSCRGCGLFEDGRKDHALWPVVLGFLGIQDSKYVPEKKLEPPSPRPERPYNPFDKWDAVDFFRHLRVKTTNAQIPEAEKRLVKLGLNYLFAESQRHRGQRDNHAVKETWKIIWPALNKHGLLEEYRKDSCLKSRVEFFLKNGF